MRKQYSRVVLADGREGIIVDMLGNDYVVDVGSSPEDWDTTLVNENLEEVGDPVKKS